VNNLSLGANGASGASVTAPAQPPTTALSLLERFGDGVINTLESAVTQPVLQVHDLLAAGASVVYNETIRSDNQPYWFPTLYSGVAAASDAGVSQTSLLLQSNPITGAGVVTYNLTTAALNGNWGDVAEQSGGLLAGLAIGKAVDAYGDYNVQSPIVPVGPGEMGMFGIKDLQSPLAPPIPDDLVDQLDLPPTTQRALLRDALGAEPGDGYQAHHVIPLQAINTFPDLMAQGAEGGFDINGANNGVLLLPSDHEGGHPVYNSVVLNQLATIDPELSPSETAQQLQGISDKLRAAIDAGTFGPWQ
jgi:hypothetical protein